MDGQNDSHKQLLNGSDEFVMWNINSKEGLTGIPGSVLLAFLIIIGISGNSLVIYVYFYHFKSSTVNMFIKVLAVLDLICCVFGMTFEMVDLLFPVLNGESYTCKIFRTIEQAAEFISCEVLVLIAFDRYLHVSRPFCVFSVQRARRLVCISVVVGIAISSPTVLIMRRSEEMIRDVKMYGCNRDTGSKTAFVYYLCVNSILLLSFIILIIEYICIWFSIYKWKHANVGQTSQIFVTSISRQVPVDKILGKDGRQTNTRTNSKEMTETGLERRDHSVTSKRTLNPDDDEMGNRTPLALRRRKTVKPTIILFAVTFIFVISYLPYFIQVMLEHTGKVQLRLLSLRDRQLWELSYKLYFLSNVLNPFVYGVFDHRFRRKCFDILFRRQYYEKVCC